MSKYIIPLPLKHSVGMVRTYLHCVDRRRSTCFKHDINQLISDDDCMELLTEILRSRFYDDVIMRSGTSHDPVIIDRLEERETAVEKFYATQPHDMETFEREFTAVFEFAFLNIRSDDLP